MRRFVSGPGGQLFQIVFQIMFQGFVSDSVSGFVFQGFVSGLGFRCCFESLFRPPLQTMYVHDVRVCIFTYACVYACV